MSNIYIQEPPSSGKVLLSTTVGDIDIELWSKEAPKACQNFVQLCMEAYYDGTLFHRLVKGFIVQGGDPTGTGTGGESIYGRPFKDEFHSRLRFVRRGLVAMANAGKDDNGSQFFFTLGATPELQNKHTIFGKVTGNTLYNMLKLEESMVDANEKPHYPHKIISTKILLNPFPDIVPRVLKKEEKIDREDKKSVAKGTKNFKLLSFGEEAEEEEAEVDAVAKGFRGKSKSSHDLTNDPKLSSVPAIELLGDEPMVKKEITEEEKQEQQESLERIRKKLRRDSPPPPVIQEKEKRRRMENSEAKMELSDEFEDTKESERERVRQEIRNIKRAIRGDTKTKAKDGDEEEKDNGKEDENVMLSDFYRESEKFQDKKKKMAKGTEREQQTLAMLAKFQSKMQTARQSVEAKEDNEKSDDQQENEDITEDEEDENDEKWLTHTLKFQEKGPVVAKDANLKVADRYEISDPRNPINERKRESSKHDMKTKRR